ncbi:hornerin-like [Neodiprion fabricii]|uniref:hornerin-like n=1 Tax=Neodiprion fabricii TaxID=2872261 RepID=UPI001ED9700A|nr:hornerin-like [Neodiprion fabricii]
MRTLPHRSALLGILAITVLTGCVGSSGAQSHCLDPAYAQSRRRSTTRTVKTPSTTNQPAVTTSVAFEPQRMYSTRIQRRIASPTVTPVRQFKTTRTHATVRPDVTTTIAYEPQRMPSMRIQRRLPSPTESPTRQLMTTLNPDVVESASKPIARRMRKSKKQNNAAMIDEASSLVSVATAPRINDLVHPAPSTLSRRYSTEDATPGQRRRVAPREQPSPFNMNQYLGLPRSSPTLRDSMIRTTTALPQLENLVTELNPHTLAGYTLAANSYGHTSIPLLHNAASNDAIQATATPFVPRGTVRHRDEISQTTESFTKLQIDLDNQGESETNKGRLENESSDSTATDTVNETPMEDTSDSANVEHLGYSYAGADDSEEEMQAENYKVHENTHKGGGGGHGGHGGGKGGGGHGGGGHGGGHDGHGGGKGGGGHGGHGGGKGGGGHGGGGHGGGHDGHGGGKGGGGHGGGGGGGHGGGGGGEGDHKFEKGGGEEHKDHHHESHGQSGEKNYKGHHEYDKGEKGYHDKEKHSGHYAEKKGDEKKHHAESGYHGEHHHGEKGVKEANFGEKGEHQKGHSTKGEHSIHKKDEYEKKTEFFDEFHEDGGNEKHGEFHHEHDLKKGGHEKSSHLDAGEHEVKHGKEHKHDKGHHYHEDKGHKQADGHEAHHKHDDKLGKKESHEEAKKWAFRKGDDGAGGGGGKKEGDGGKKEGGGGKKEGGGGHH